MKAISLQEAVPSALALFSSAVFRIWGLHLEVFPPREKIKA
jgi:hypothetical protein